ncbi:type II toxin-antitoxin system VapC family toxin [Nocardia otitidiscaviarum]|uniref:type II toxin-antitoxin system VapC family toxin n=1 Tax=Nocardia otitidiscaviarum TaxID=1823 RepID=UPI002458EAC5|nr:type II toxin-antitoxin system VapC family toxin [Nocardia otitidiscaviarum]
MIVADASAVVELLVGDSKKVAARFVSNPVYAPAHVDFEVAKVIRRLHLSGKLDEHRSSAAIQDLARLPIARIPLADLLPRVWQLRCNAYPGDAFYLALAEDLACPLVTADAKLSATPGHHASIVTI